MWELVFNLLPVLAFLTGTFLGGLIVYLFNREHRKHYIEQAKNSSNTNIALESQLKAKSRLENDLSRTNSELEKLREQLNTVHKETAEVAQSLKKENFNLKKKIKKYKAEPIQSPKGSKHVANEYQAFLTDLEKSIKKAKKKAFTADEPIISKKKVKKKNTKASNSGKYDFFKEKYAGKKLDATALFSEKKEVVKDLTALYGIDHKVQELLNAEGIKSFSDLSRTKIATLKKVLSKGGKRFQDKNPLNWPIQARLAEKGQWDILEDYKTKMNNAS